MTRWWVVLAAIAACRSQRDHCGDAIDAAFARTHAQRQTEARENPERRDALEDEQYADDLFGDKRRGLYVDHCVADAWMPDQLECVAEGDVDRCLSYGQRRDLAADRVEMTMTDLGAVYRKLADRMCRCTDTRCTDRVTAAMTKFGQDMSATIRIKPGGVAPDMQGIMKRYSDCLTARYR